MSNAVTRILELDSYGINPQQAQFAEEYLTDLDGKAAAIRAGYAPSSAAVQANRLLNHVGVAAYIGDMMEERQQRTMITQDQVLRELALLGLSNVENFIINDAGNVELATGARSEEMKTIKKMKRTIKYDKEGNKITETELEFWDKVAALRLAGKHLGMFTEINLHAHKHEHEVKQVWDFGGQEVEF